MTLLDPEAVHVSLDEMDGWSGDTSGIVKRYRFDDFRAAIAFVNRVADVAEEMDHHPDLAISYDTVEATITSHAEGGVTQECIDLGIAMDGVRT